MFCTTVELVLGCCGQTCAQSAYEISEIKGHIHIASMDMFCM